MIPLADIARARHARNRVQGFTLIELLVVVAIIGILASISIPGLLTAIDKAKQTSSIGLMRAYAVALQIYQNDNNYFPLVGTMNDLIPLLAPYSDTLKPMDAWRRNLAYTADADHYTLECFGKDGVRGLPITPETRYEFVRDIVLQDGVFANSVQ